MSKNPEVDDCLKKVKSSSTINTIGDVRNRLNDCAKKLKQEERQPYAKDFQQVFEEKTEELKERHSEKGQSYGYIPAHQQSGQRSLYRSQKRHG
jgi:hypothetical protein